MQVTFLYRAEAIFSNSFPYHRFLDWFRLCGGGAQTHIYINRIADQLDDCILKSMKLMFLFIFGKSDRFHDNRPKILAEVKKKRPEMLLNTNTFTSSTFNFMWWTEHVTYFKVCNIHFIFMACKISLSLKLHD